AMLSLPASNPLPRYLHVRSLHMLAAFAFALATSGCASVNLAKPEDLQRDPLEGMNRAIYGFNRSLDIHAINPAAKAYRRIVPIPVRTAVRNVFSNLNDIPVTLNSALQGQWKDCVQSFARLAVNSTVGLLGLIDWASDGGAPKHDEDFGQTLGHYGIGSGAYLVLPVLGPASLRDGVGLAVDAMASPLYPYDTYPKAGALVLNVVSARAQFPGLREALDQQPDEYAFVKNAYLQKRTNKLFYGKPPAMGEE
ncbi:MAG: VacJ family lipoprotein, partial [Thiobacillaceae bacterium]